MIEQTSDFEPAIHPESGIFNLNWKELNEYQELLFFLALRKLKIRYTSAEQRNTSGIWCDMISQHKRTNIEVKDLSKGYRIGSDVLYKQLSESLTNVVPHSVRTLRDISILKGPILGTQRRQLRSQARRGPRHHRDERRRQEHAPQDPLPDHLFDRGRDRHAGPGQLPPRVYRPGEHLLQRCHPRHEGGLRSMRGLMWTRCSLWGM